MASSINASTTAGVVTTADTSGVLNIQTAGTTAIAIDASQAVSFTNAPTVTGGTANGVAYLNGSKVLTTGSALVFDGTNLSLGTVGAKVNFATTGSATVNYVGGSADGYSLEMVMQRGASQPLKYKQDYGVGHVWSIAGSDKMTLDASGNLLVGTTTANANFYVYNAPVSYAGLNATAIFSSSASQSTGTGGLIAFEGKYTSGGALANFAAIGGLKENSTDSNYSGYLGFYTRSNGSLAAERARIDSSGNLMVGDTSAAGRVLAKSATSDGTTSSYVGKNSSGTILLDIISTGYFKTGVAANSPYNNATGSGANVFVGSDGALFRSTSSLKYKTDVQDATFGIADVLKLRAVTYKGKGSFDGDKVFAGLIAEEVHDSGLTQFVQYAEDGSPDALSYGNMVSLCIKAIQEQQALITQLQADVAALKGA